MIILVFITCPLFGNLEFSVGTAMQVNVTSYDLSYSYSMDATVLYSIFYPFLVGAKFDYQENFKRLSILSVWRLLPENWWIKIDLIGGGGLSSINNSEFKYVYFTGGISPKIFFEQCFFYISAYYTDITTDIKAYSFVNGSVGVGIYF